MHRVRVTVNLLLAAAGIGLGQYVEDSIDVGGAGVYNMAYNPTADVVYGTSSVSNGRLFAVACSGDVVVAQIPLYKPYALAYDSIDEKLYCGFSRMGTWDSIVVVDGGTHTRLRALSVTGARMLCWNSANNRLYVSCGDENDIAVLDCRTDSILTRIPVGQYPGLLHLNRSHQKLYVQNYDDCSVSIVDLNTNQVIRTIPLGSEPQAGWFSVAAGKFYCSLLGRRIAVIDGVGDTILRSIETPGSSWARSMAENTESGLLFAGIEDGMSYHSLWAVDVAVDTPVSHVSVPYGPEALLWSQSSNLLYCANFDGFVTVLSGDGARVLDTLRVASSPFALAYSRERHRLYVGHVNSRKVYVVRDVLGVEEARYELARPRPAAAFVARGVLNWTGPVARLTDITGRGVAKLRPGAVGIAGLSPGVYFVVTPTSTGSIPSAPQKVVITR